MKILWVVLFVCLSCMRSQLLVNDNFPISRGEHISNEIIAEYAKKMAGNDLDAVGFGRGLWEGKEDYLEVSFVSDKVLNLNLARILIVDTVKAFLININSREDYSPYVAVFPMTVANVSVSICAEDKPTEKLPLWVSSVASERGVIYYYKPVEGKRCLEIVYKETFEEALAVMRQQSIE